MRVCFCVWCVKCAKYLAFGTFERADDSALITFQLLAGKIAHFHVFECNNENELQNISGFSYLVHGININIFLIPNNYMNHNFHSQHVE